jgi:hypothetical protein
LALPGVTDSFFGATASLMVSPEESVSSSAAVSFREDKIEFHHILFHGGKSVWSRLFG